MGKARMALARRYLCTVREIWVTHTVPQDPGQRDKDVSCKQAPELKEPKGVSSVPPT